MRYFMDDVFIDTQRFYSTKNIKDEDALIITRTQYHLEQLFNSKKNSISHMPDYGLSDLFLIYQNLPYSIQNLMLEIKSLINTYEKNITELSLQINNLNDVNIIFTIILSCKINHMINANFLINFYENRFIEVALIKSS